MIFGYAVIALGIVVLLVRREEGRDPRVLRLRRQKTLQRQIRRHARKLEKSKAKLASLPWEYHEPRPVSYPGRREATRGAT